MKKDIPPCEIYIDRDGRWFHRGLEMIHREIILEFYRNMSRDSLGNYIISYQGETCYVEVEDTPFIINRIAFRESEEAGQSGIALYINDETREDLCPETLFVGDENVLYCRIKVNKFKARFSRAAYYQLAEYIKEGGDGFYLPLNNKDYKIGNRG